MASDGMLSLSLVLSLLFIGFGPLSKGAEQNQLSVQEQLTRCDRSQVLKMLRHSNALATVSILGFETDTVDSCGFRASYMAFWLGHSSPC